MFCQGNKNTPLRVVGDGDDLVARFSSACIRARVRAERGWCVRERGESMIINKHTGTTRESPSAVSQKCNIALQMWRRRLSLFATALSLTLSMDVHGVQQQQQQQWPSTESDTHKRKRRSSATHICFWRFLCVCDEQTITRE
jgi:hypothetical protein